MWKNANIDQRLFSKILNGDKPSKKTAILLALALELSYEDALTFLGYAGYTLSKSYREDILVKWHIKNHRFSVFDVCANLYQLGLPTFFYCRFEGDHFI